MYEHCTRLRFERRGRILTLTMTNPPLNAVDRALHDELAPYGVTVTVLAPGLTDTAFTRNAGHEASATLKLMLMQPRPVAEAGLRALDAGRSCVVPGWLNKSDMQPEAEGK